MREHVVPLDSLRDRLTFEPVVPAIPGYELLGALDAPNRPVDHFPPAPTRLTSVQLVYRVGANGPLVVLSEEDLEDGGVWATIPTEAFNTDVEGRRAVHRALRSTEQSQRTWSEISFFEERRALLYNIGAYSNLGAIRPVARALSSA